MRSRVVSLLMLMIFVTGCGIFFENWMTAHDPIIDYDPMTPTPTPTIVIEQVPYSLEITIEPENPRVGDVITLNYRLINMGIPVYTITFTPGGALRMYYGAAQPTITAPLENSLVEILDLSTLAQGTLRMRALAAGALNVQIYASGEVQMAAYNAQGTPIYAFYFTGVSETVEIVISE